MFTIYRSIVIDHLEAKTDGRNAQVVYVYCNYKEQSEQTAMNLVKSLLRQLVEKEKTISPRICGLYDKFIKSQKRPSIEEWTEILLAEVSILDIAYIVIDAFDEYSEVNRTRTELLQALRMIVKDPRVQLLITARPMTVVDIDLDRTRSLRILAHPEDMKLYLESQIDREERLSRIIQRDPGLRGCIVDTIVSKANGMFLAAELHLASLASKNSLSKVHKSLETIPEDLDGVYDEAMLRIEAQNRDDLQLAESILSWITYAYRPLKLIELCHALAVEPEEDTLDPENMPDILTLVDICAGLVTIDESSGVIRLVHFTTQDYFQRLRITRFPQAQTYITKICLAYLLIKEFEDGCSLSEPELIARAKRFPFLTYAASFWARHMRSAEKGGLIDKDVREMALNLLKSKHPFANAYQADYWEKKETFQLPSSYRSCPATLRHCAWFDMDSSGAYQGLTGRKRHWPTWSFGIGNCGRIQQRSCYPRPSQLRSTGPPYKHFRPDSFV